MKATCTPSAVFSWWSRSTEGIVLLLTADCTGLEIDTEKRLLLQTRPTFGGNVMATIICQAKRPQMSTVRPRVFKRNAPDKGRKGQVIRVNLDKEPVTSPTKLLDFIKDLTETVKLEDADIIVIKQ